MIPLTHHACDNPGVFNSLNSILPTLPIAPRLLTPLPFSPSNSNLESADIQSASPLPPNSTFKFSNTALNGTEINDSKDSQHQSQFV